MTPARGTAGGRRRRISGALAIVLTPLLTGPAAASTKTNLVDEDDLPREPAAEADVSVLGRVVYAGARTEIPIGRHAALVPAAEIVALTPVAGVPGSELHPYFGLGLANELDDDWDWEVSFLGGPRTDGLTKIEALIDVSKGFDADWAHDRPPTVELELTIGAAELNGSAGSLLGDGVTQVHADLVARLRLADVLVVRPRVVYFFYDQPLTLVTADEIDQSAELALVGTFAPRALAGARLTWNASAVASPLVEASEIFYLGGIGTGTQIQAGARVDIGRAFHATIAGGLLHNRLNGVAATTGQTTVPAFEVGLELRY